METQQINTLKQQLSTSYNRYKCLYENSPDMLLSVNPENTKIAECNETFIKKMGYTKAEIIGKSIFFIYHPKCLKKVENAYKTFLDTGKVDNTELILKTKKGSKIHVLLKVNSIKDKNNKIVYSNSCFRDITELKKLQTRHLAYQRFAGIISDKFSNALNTINIAVNQLNKAPFLSFDEKAQYYVNSIEQASKNINYIANKLNKKA